MGASAYTDQRQRLLIDDHERNSVALGSIAGQKGYTNGYNWDNRADWPCSDILLDRCKLLVGKAFEFPAPVAQVDRARDS